MNKNIFALLIAVAVIGTAFFFGMKKNNVPTSTKTADQTGNSDKGIIDGMAVNNLVTNFYKALELQDGKVLFGYFTPPATDKEKTDFNWLTGADLAGTPIYRAFFRQKISSPKISEMQVNDTTYVNNTSFVVKISDQIVGIPSAGSENTVYTPKSRSVVLTIIKSGDRWMVDKFTDPTNTSNTGNAGSPKYNGFGQ